MGLITGALKPPEEIEPPAAPSPKTTSATTTMLSGENITNPIGAATQFQGAPQYTASKGQTYEVTDNELVAKQLENLINKNSAYVQLGRNKGLATANSRGLLNSSIAAEAGVKGAYEYALPIAQQDATTYSNRGQMREQGIIDSYARNQADANTASLYGVQAGYESALSKQEHGQAATLQAQAAEAETRIQQMNIDAEKYLKSVGITADAQAALVEHTRIAGQEYMVAYDRILRDPNFDSETSRATALQRLTEVYENNLDLVAAVAEVQTTAGTAPSAKPSAPVAGTPSSAIINRAASNIDYSVPTPTIKTASGMDLWNIKDPISAKEAVDIINRERTTNRSPIPLTGGAISDVTKRDPRLTNVNIDKVNNYISRGYSSVTGSKTFAEWARLFDSVAGQRESGGGK